MTEDSMLKEPLTHLLQQLQKRFGNIINSLVLENDELTLEVDSLHLLAVCQILRDDPNFRFEMLMDLAGVDYLEYGKSEWVTTDATKLGFERGVLGNQLPDSPWEKPRFAVVYHLLSITHNIRLRLRTFALNDPPTCPSVLEIWNSANWYEREAFDLFGILFEEHPDLRRILTDYGFIGHPFRKDFPLIGQVEMRFDAASNRVIYEPVSIQPRVLVPKTIRRDNRYIEAEESVSKVNG